MRLSDSVETALRLGGGIDQVLLLMADKKQKLKDEERIYSEHFACVYCNLSFGELEPRNFSSTARTAPAATAPASASRWSSTRIARHPQPEPLDRRGRDRPVVPHQQPSPPGTCACSSALARKHGFALNTPVKELTDEAAATSCSTATRAQITLQYTGAGGHVQPAGTPPSRASSPTSRAATRRPTPSTSAPRSSATWPRSPARPAAALASSRSRSPSPSTAATSSKSPTCPSAKR